MWHIWVFLLFCLLISKLGHIFGLHHDALQRRRKRQYYKLSRPGGEGKVFNGKATIMALVFNHYSFHYVKLLLIKVCNCIAVILVWPISTSTSTVAVMLRTKMVTSREERRTLQGWDFLKIILLIQFKWYQTNHSQASVSEFLFWSPINCNLIKCDCWSLNTVNLITKSWSQLTIINPHKIPIRLIFIPFLNISTISQFL